MKKVFTLLTISICIGLLSISCNPTDSVDEINLQEEESTGNDKVVRKKPG